MTVTGTKNREEEQVMQINQMGVGKNRFEVSWDAGEGQKNWWAKYPPDVDLSLVPRELFWVMFGMATSEEWAWNLPLEVHLPEHVDERILRWWKGMMLINHMANPYGLDTGEARIEFINGREDTIRPLFLPLGYPHISEICMNGMGKDALAQIGMVNEVSDTPLCLTVDNRWAFSKPEIYDRIEDRIGELHDMGYPASIVSTNANEVFDLHIMPWYIYALPLMWLHQSKTCYHAEEIEFNKYVSGVPIKPNTSIPVLMSINKLLKSLGYGMEFRSGTAPLSSYGTQKLLVERYPGLQKLQTSCMHGFPNCNRCAKCRCHRAYIEMTGRKPRDHGYQEEKLLVRWKLAKVFDPEKLLDIERESQHYALSPDPKPAEFSWVKGYWEDALPYGIPDSERVLREHFKPFRGSMTSYGKYEYDVRKWDDTATGICSGKI